MSDHRSRTLRIRPNQQPSYITLSQYTSSSFGTIPKSSTVALIEKIEDQALVSFQDKVGLIPISVIRKKRGKHKRGRSFDRNELNEMEPAPISRIIQSAVVIKDYKGEKDQLSVRIGDEVIVHGSEQNGWIHCESRGRNGYVPFQLLRLLNGRSPTGWVIDDYEGMSIGDEVVVLKKDQSGWWHCLSKKRKVEVLPSDYILESDYMTQLRAYYDCQGGAGMLKFKSGDVINALGRVSDDWWFGSVRDSYGYVSNMHVAKTENQYRRAMLTVDTVSSPAMIGASCGTVINYLETIKSNKNWGRFKYKNRVGLVRLVNIVFEDEQAEELYKSDFSEKEFQMFQGALIKLQQQTKMTIQALLSKLENTDRNRLVLLSVLKEVGEAISINDHEVSSLGHIVKKNMEITEHLTNLKIQLDIEETRQLIQEERDKIYLLDQELSNLAHQFETVQAYLHN